MSSSHCSRPPILILALFLVVQSAVAFVDQSAVIGSFSQVHPDALIGQNVQIGSFAKIGRSSVFKPNAVVGDFANVGPFVTVGSNSVVGNYASLQANVVMNDNSIVDQYSRLQNNVTLQSRAQVGKFARIDSNVIVGSGAFVNDYARIANGAELKEKSIVDMYGSVGAGSSVSERGYVGEYASVGNGATVGALSVIHRFAPVPSQTTVPEKQVIIASPRSSDLFSIVKGSDACNNARLATIAQSTEFNTSIAALMSEQFEQLTNQCNGLRQVKMDNLPCIVALYLRRYYGNNRYEEIYQQIFSEMNIYNQLQRETHFGQNPTRTILSPVAQQEFIKLLAIDQDIGRAKRVEGDQLCDMIEQIKTNQRPVQNNDRNDLRGVQVESVNLFPDLNANFN